MAIKRIDFIVDHHIIEVSPVGFFIYPDGVRKKSNPIVFDLKDIARIVKITEEKLDEAGIA